MGIVQWFGLWFSLAMSTCMGAEPARLQVVSREVFIASPRPGVRVIALTDYAHATGLEMFCQFIEQTRSDKADIAYRRFSSDNGRTWSKPQTLATNWKVDGGTARREMRTTWADPDRDVLVAFILQGVLPTDHPLEGMKHWRLRYALSRDGGKTFYYEAPIIQQGPDYNADHPLAGVWVGRNSVMIGDTTCDPIRLRTGEILQPIQITPLGPGGEYYNPGGGLTYHDSAVLIGRWNRAGTLDWDLSVRVEADPARSTRGMIEPTVIEAPDGRVLMVCRGSNDRKPKLPGYRWYAVSEDHGRSFSKPVPWTYADGSAFYSPSACSQLLKHPNGRIYWIGNISPTNPRGNSPRYPLVIGEVDPDSLLLKRETVTTIEDRAPNEPAWSSASNFYAHLDRPTGQIVVHCSPLGKIPPAGAPASQPAKRPFEWTSHAMIYRIAVP